MNQVSLGIPLRHINIPIFIPEQGCPNQCIFCNQRAITNQDTPLPPEQVRSFALEWIKNSNTKGKIISLAFFGGSFTGIPSSTQIAYLKEALKLKEEALIDKIRLSTRPDYINPETIKRLLDYSVDIVELGIQSLNDDVLKASKRGHSSQTTLDACASIKDVGMHLIMQTMIGLPQSSTKIDYDTAQQIINIKPDGVRIYPCLVFTGSELEHLYKHKLYTPLTLNEAIKRSAQLTTLYESNNIPILRIGLHASSGNQALIAGPFHPSFKALVETELWNGLIKERLNSQLNEPESPFNNTFKTKILTIKANPSSINHVVGFEGKNKKELLLFFKDVRFIKDSLLKSREFEISFSL